jgi:hypothetical protein
MELQVVFAHYYVLSGIFKADITFIGRE